MNHPNTASPRSAAASPPGPGAGKPVRFTLIAAVVASTAAFLVVLAELPIWAMFVGWVTWFLRPTSIRDGLSSIACLWAGLLLAIAAHLAIGALVPVVGPVAFPITVFGVAVLVVGLHRMPVLGNPLAWFLGLISSFALHAPEPVRGVLVLAAATAIGAGAALLCQRLQRRLAQ